MPQKGFTSRTIPSETDNLAVKLAAALTIKGREQTGNDLYNVSVQEIILLALRHYEQDFYAGQIKND